MNEERNQERKNERKRDKKRDNNQAIRKVLLADQEILKLSHKNGNSQVHELSQNSGEKSKNR
jgi:hypothetical protein